VLSAGCSSSGGTAASQGPATESDGSAHAGGASALGAGGVPGAAAGGDVNASNAGGTSTGSGGRAAQGAGGAAQSNGGSTGAGGVVVQGDLPTACGGARGTNVGAGSYGTASGTTGSWQDVTPSGVDLTPSSFNNDNFGAQDIVVDPVRPSDFYAFVCHQGVWKSTDYGGTWTKVNTGKNGDQIDKGKPWGSGIDTSWCRDPAKPPTLYTLAGAGPMGFWRSTDGGVSWTQIRLPDKYGQDAYSISVDPYDGAHVLMGYHEAIGLVESSDAGSTWTPITPADPGISVYPFFIDTGDPATTRKTWLTIGQTGALQRTTDGGASWKQVETLQHAHGCSTMFQAGEGVEYVAGLYGTKGNGVYRSADYGATFDLVAGATENGVTGTASTLYASYAWANSGGLDPALMTAPRSPGTSWSVVATPSGMTNGWKGVAVSFDGTHHVIVSGNWNAGFWRYIEP
jgi:hypothetical protein